MVSTASQPASHAGAWPGLPSLPGTPDTTAPPPAAIDTGARPESPAPREGAGKWAIDAAAAPARSVTRAGATRVAPAAGAVEPAVPAYGQIVVVIARWILVLAGFGLALWNPAPLAQLRTQILVLLLLAVANFYLHAQLLRRRPVIDSVAYGASAADLAVITILVMVQGGFESHLHVFYYVALLGIAVAFPAGTTALLTGATASVYGLISLATLSWDAGDTELLAITSRLLMMVAVAVCGALYRDLEWTRRRTGAAEDLRHEAAQDIFFGQVVLIWARWFVIIAGAILALWTSPTTEALTINIIPVVALMAMNFYLHARYLLEQPANPRLIKAVSVLDLVMVTAIVLVWTGHPGLDSPFFVYYYPVVLAFAFVFPPRIAGAFTIATLALYLTVCLVMDPVLVTQSADLKMLAVRLITLAAVGGLGTYYWRTQRALRRSTPAAAAVPPIATTVPDLDGARAMV